MSRPLWLGLFGLLVFLVALVWTAPLAVVADWAGLDRRGIFYERAQGTIWSGDLLGVSAAGQPLGRITLDLKPASLLTGQLAYRMDVVGPAGTGRGELGLGLGGGMAFTDWVADINIQGLQRLDPRLRQVPSTVSVTLPQLKAGRTLDCKSADGRLRTDLLEKLGTGLQWDGPAMAGVIACDGEGGYQLNLANVGGNDEIALDATALPQRASYEAEARVRTASRSVADTLVLMGFQRVGDEFVYSRANGTVRSIGEAG